MYRPSPEEFDDVRVSACSAEPMRKPDHKAKKHARPRRNEKVGGGHFVFRRGDHGRVTPNGFPFEHPNLASANDEAYRLAALTGGTFEVYQCQNVVTADEARAADLETWDRPPLEDMTLDMHAEVRRIGGAA